MARFWASLRQDRILYHAVEHEESGVYIRESDYMIKKALQGQNLDAALFEIAWQADNPSHNGHFQVLRTSVQ